MEKVVIINTGVANIASVLAAFERANKEAILSTNKDDILAAHYAVLPGVGTFQAGISKLCEFGLVEALRTRVTNNQPLLAVCLGMQLLFNSSEESPGVEGLGFFSGSIKRFNEPLRVPQFGWNSVEPNSECRLLKKGYAYFANSFRLTTVPAGTSPAFSNYGDDFVAAFEYKNLLACQFHPELSGQWGQDLIERWLKQC